MGARGRGEDIFFEGFAERILYTNVFAQELNAPGTCRTKKKKKSSVRRTQRRPSAEASRWPRGARASETYMDTSSRRRLHSFDHIFSIETQLWHKQHECVHLQADTDILCVC